MKWSQYSFINKKNGSVLFTFEGEMEAAYAYIFQMSPNRMFSDAKGFENWLNKRAYLLLRGKTDSQVIKELGIEEMAGSLGKMTDGAVLYAFLNHFESERDDYVIYPVQDTVHACMFSDYRFYRIYQMTMYRNRYQRPGTESVPFYSHKEEGNG